MKTLKPKRRNGARVSTVEHSFQNGELFAGPIAPATSFSRDWKKLKTVIVFFPSYIFLPPKLGSVNPRTIASTRSKPSVLLTFILNFCYLSTFQISY